MKCLLCCRLHKLATLEFDRHRKSMSVIARGPGGANVLLVKGAAEVVVERCTSVMLAGGAVKPLTPAVKAALMGAVDRMAEDALRCLALAQKVNFTGFCQRCKQNRVSLARGRGLGLSFTGKRVSDVRCVQYLRAKARCRVPASEASRPVSKLPAALTSSSALIVIAFWVATRGNSSPGRLQHLLVPLW